ncbi:hypothetical protein V501_09121, partial [Pseudogymnoascus sp. VKM F-4519 (FW-2642)]
VEVDTKDTMYGRTPLSWAVGNGHEAIVHQLLEKGAEVDTKDSDGQTPLSWAAGKGHEVVVQLLLETDAELDIKDSDGQTPLFWAVKNGHEAVVRLLLEKGAEKGYILWPDAAVLVRMERARGRRAAAAREGR